MSRKWIDRKFGGKDHKMLLNESGTKAIGSYFFREETQQWESSAYRHKDDRKCYSKPVYFKTEAAAKKHVLNTPVDHTS